MFIFKNAIQNSLKSWNFTTPSRFQMKLQDVEGIDNQDQQPSFAENFIDPNYQDFFNMGNNLDFMVEGNEDTSVIPQDQVERAQNISQNQNNSTSNNKRVFNNKKEFVQTLNNSYKRALKKLGFDQGVSLMLVAQDALETGYGAKVKGKYNFGNITTAGSDWTVKTGSHHWKDFKSIDDYTEYKVKFLNNKRYRMFYDMPNIRNVSQTMQILANRGYCPGSPQYGSKINQVYQSILKNYV